MGIVAESFDPVSELTAEDWEEGPEELELIRKLATRAEGYLTSQRWCAAVQDLRFGDGVGGVVGVFLARPQYAKSAIDDEWLWVIVGDLPSA